MPVRGTGDVFATVLADLVGFLGLGTYQMANLLIPLWAVRIGADARGVGLAVATGYLGAVFLGIPAGALCDRWGAGRVLVAAGCAGAASAALTPWLGRSLTGLVVLQFVGGTGRNLVWMAAQTLISEVVPPGQRLKHISFFSFSSTLGSLCGPLAAGFVAERHGFGTAFHLMAAVSFLLALLAGYQGRRMPAADGAVPVSAPVPVPVAAAGGHGEGVRAAVRLFTEAGVVLAIAGTFLRLFAFGIRDSFLPVHLERAGYTPTAIGSVVSFGTLCSLAASPWTAVVARRSPAAVMLWTSALGTAAVAATASFQSPPAVAAAMAVFGVAMGFNQPLLIALLADAVPATLRGLGLGVRATANALGSVVSPLLLGALVARTSLTAGFLLVGSGGVAMTALLALYWRRATRWPAGGAAAAPRG
ncbi:MAG: MFS transporter [Clostridia bacterium]|nr:MFS transporter [Clostridia bacterium]